MDHSVGTIVCNILTAIAYYVITIKLFLFARDPVVMSLFASKSGQGKKKQLLTVLVAVIALFLSFISLCGSTHAMHVLCAFYPDNQSLKLLQFVILVVCALVSAITALCVFKLFPAILQALGKLELNDEGGLTHAENYLLEIVETIKESIIVLSPDKMIIRGNEASRAMFGKSMVGTSVVDAIHPDDRRRFEDTIERLVNSYSFETVTIDYRVRTLIQSENAYQSLLDDNLSTSSLSPRTDDFGWVESTICKGRRINSEDNFEYDLRMISRNVDDRRRKEEYKHILAAAREQERTNEAKMRYISCIAHDLKTPLQSFCFTIDLLHQSTLTADQLDLIRQSEVAVDLMKLTISQTMDISKALTGAKLQPRRGSVQLSLIIQRVSIIINGYGKQVPVDFDLHSNVNDYVITDEEWLWQMLLNLLTNACKYTAKGSIRVVVSLKQPAASPAAAKGPSKVMIGKMGLPLLKLGDAALGPTQLLFEVIDTGVGIPDDKLAGVFDAFSQVQSGQVTGTGLGLFGVRMRAEGLQGTCGARRNYESSTNTGTVMWFAIPYIVDESSASTPMSARLRSGSGTSSTTSLEAYLPSPHFAPTPKAVSTPTLRSIAEHKMTAMVVDDTLTIRKLMERMLLQMGFESVVCYENGAKGLDAMMAAPVDIVFSDVQMPIMTGPEMVKRFREFEKGALLSGERQHRQLSVAVTANGEDCSAIGENGFDLICPKPVDKNALSRIIQNHLNSKDSRFSPKAESTQSPSIVRVSVSDTDRSSVETLVGVDMTE